MKSNSKQLLTGIFLGLVAGIIAGSYSKNLATAIYTGIGFTLFIVAAWRMKSSDDD